MVEKNNKIKIAIEKSEQKILDSGLYLEDEQINLNSLKKKKDTLKNENNELIEKLNKNETVLEEKSNELAEKIHEIEIIEIEIEQEEANNLNDINKLNEELEKIKNKLKSLE